MKILGTMVAIGLLAVAAACGSPGALPTRQSGDQDNTCPLCREQTRLAREHDAGRISDREWIDRRIALLEGEYLTNRLSLLEEREKTLVLESESALAGDLLETKLEIASLKYALKNTDEKEWKARRDELVTKYKSWLGEQSRDGKMSEEEVKRRASNLEAK